MQKNNCTESFLRIPKVLFTDPLYKSLSSPAKLMYGLLLDRESLSRKNGWLDENGRVYIYYTIKEMSKDLGFGRDKVIALFDTLEENGLLTRHRKGVNKPWCITVNRVGISDFAEWENTTSRGRENRLHEVGNTDFNNTDINKTDISDIFSTSSYEEAEENIREQIEYECLCSTYGKDTVDSVVSLICDALFNKAKNVSINGGMYSSDFVRKRLLSLNSEHIGYALEVISNSGQEITNVRHYLLSVLFNAPSAMDSYFSIRTQTDRK